jgi:hypothetical protein
MRLFCFIRSTSYLLLFIIVLTANGCLLKKEKEVPQKEESGDERMDDIESRIQYEFNMIKDPATNSIPEGIHEKEMEQARQVQLQNSLTTPTVSNVYSFQGPNNLGGRTRALAYDVRYNGGSNQTIMAGGISGGIFKSNDDGATWVRKSPLGEHFSCTSLAQDPRVGFQNTWYYTTGEASGNSTGAAGAFYTGNGVYKSTDNGETWARLVNSNTTPLESFSVAQDIINKVIVDPINGNIYIACAATIRRSVDGGTTWTSVLNGTLANSNQFTDIVVTSTGKLYAAFAGTNTSTVDGVWSSLPGATSGDAGSWTRIAGTGAATNPAGWNAVNGYGRVVLGIAPSLETRVYALYYNNTTSNCAGVAAPEAELFRWDDGSSAWTDLSANLPNEAGCSNGNDPFAVQGGYDLVVSVKPDDPNAVFIGGTNVYRSTDGFTSTANTTRLGGYAGTGGYTQYANSHPDIHGIVFKPGTTTTMLCCNDGGIQRTTDNLAAAVAWTPINTGYRSYQYYYVDIDPRFGNDKVIGGAQDNGSTRNIGGAGTNFELVTGGDGVSVGLSDIFAGAQTEYVGSQNGNINRRQSTVALGFINASIIPTGVTGGLFVTLFKLDPDNSQTLYYANDNELFYTTAASSVTPGTWNALTGVATSVGTANDITAIATTRGTYAAATASLFFGTSNGKVFRLDDPTGAALATAPVDISGAGFPAGGYVSSVAVNPRNDDTVLVTFSNYGVSSIWWTGNANSATPAWTSIEGNISLPSVRASAIVAKSTGIEYYVGTSVGLYSTTAISGATVWAQEGSSDIGNAVVTCLALRANDNTMAIGTHGYGMWKTTIGSPIPVIISSFTGKAEKKYNVLNWEVTSETNNKGFYIERKQKGDINYTPIGFISGRGNSSTPKAYSYTDNILDLSSEQALYRLKQADFDGRYAYSDIVLLRRTASGKLVEYIAADASTLLIRINSISNDNIRIRITDMSGREMYQQQTTALTQRIPIANWAAGTYVAEVWMGNQRAHVQQFVKP